MSPNHSAPVRRLLLLCVSLLLAVPVIAASSLLDSLTSKDASGGLKAALSQGIDTRSRSSARRTAS